MTAPAALDRAFALRAEVREEKRAIERHRQALRNKAAELRQMCEALGFTYDEFKTEGSTAHGQREQRID